MVPGARLARIETAKAYLQRIERSKPPAIQVDQ